MLGPSFVPIATEQTLSVGAQPVNIILKTAPLRELGIMGDLLSQTLRLTAEFLDRSVIFEHQEGVHIALGYSFELTEPFELSVRRVSRIVESRFKNWVVGIRRCVAHDAAQDMVGQRASILAEKSNESLAIGGIETRPGFAPLPGLLVRGENEGEPFVPVQRYLGSRELREHRLKSHYFSFPVV